MTAQGSVALYCIKCHGKLFDDSDLCFYAQSYSSTHLIILPEKHAITKEEAEQGQSPIALDQANEQEEGKDIRVDDVLSGVQVASGK